jgi:TolA-binding protein
VATAALWALGCAANDPVRRKDVDDLRAEMRTIQRENAEMSRRLEGMEVRLDALAAVSRAPPPAPSPASAPAAAAEPLVPPNLAVVKVDRRRPEPRRPRQAPALPTAVPISEPDPGEMAALGTPRGDIAAEAQAALDAARRLDGLASARALEEFVSRYPRHPSADNALVEAARARDAAGDPETACALAARVAEEYPAGDALPDALAQMAECRARQGDIARARALYQRIVKDFPDTPAARRARERLAAPTETGAPASAAHR